jgi:tRNA G18 (ribose-2'-O)-methylase SpoU
MEKTLEDTNPSGPAASDPNTADGERALEFLLYGLQSPINIGMILRVAETYRFRVSIYDKFRVLDDPDKLRTVRDFACGAADRRGFRNAGDEAGLRQILKGRRLIATSIERGATSLPAYRFRRGDVFALGNEYDGLPQDVIARADAVLNIPMPLVWTPKPRSLNPIDPARTASVAREGQPNLNVAMSAGIICYAAFADWLTSEEARTPAGAMAASDA